MIRRYCDRCSREIKTQPETVINKFVSLFSTKQEYLKLVKIGEACFDDEIELCEKCYQDLVKWFKEDNKL